MSSITTSFRTAYRVLEAGELKKFLLFTFYAGRPLGGAHDFLESFDTIDEALDNILDERTRYFQIVDRDTMQIVRQGLARFKNFSPEAFRRDPQGPRTDK